MTKVIYQQCLWEGSPLLGPHNMLPIGWQIQGHPVQFPRQGYGVVPVTIVELPPDPEPPAPPLTLFCFMVAGDPSTESVTWAFPTATYQGQRFGAQYWQVEAVNPPLTPDFSAAPEGIDTFIVTGTTLGECIVPGGS